MNFKASIAVVLITALAACGGGGDSPPPPAPAPVATGPVSIAVTPSNATDYWGYTIQMQATPKDASGASLTGQTITWTSSDTAVATVDAAGLVTLLKPGAIQVKATIGSVVSNIADVKAEGFSDVIASSLDDTCSTNEARTQIICWGNGNAIEKNRTGTTVVKTTPTPLQMGSIPTGTKIKQIAPNFHFSCALSDDGEVYCWNGTNTGANLAELGIATGTDPNLPQKILAGEKPNGVIYKQLITKRQGGACAVGSDNEIYCWGQRTAFGVVQNKPSPLPAIYTEPKRLARGYLAGGQPLVSVNSGLNGDCGIDGTGKPFCYLPSTSGDIPTLLATGAVPTNVRLTSMASNDLGDFFSALGDDGWAYTIGKGYGYNYGDGSSISALSTTQKVARVAQGVIPLTERLVSISTGGGNGATCVVSDVGSAYCWGNEASGAMGTGVSVTINQFINTPKKVVQGEIPTGVRLLKIVCGNVYCNAYASDRKIYSWGGGGVGSSTRPNLGRVGGDFTVPLEIGRISKN
jgi:alpha-tubulin suppressor-like RCC1 family protein